MDIRVLNGSVSSHRANTPNKTSLDCHLFLVTKPGAECESCPKNGNPDTVF